MTTPTTPPATATIEHLSDEISGEMENEDLRAIWPLGDCRHDMPARWLKC